MTKHSIIIPTVNNIKYLMGCIDSIFKSSKMDEVELIIVDNGSKDATPSFLDQLQKQIPTVKVIKNPENVGFCKATNQGMAVATGKYITWLNDDTIVSINWLDILQEAIHDPNNTHPNVGLVGPFTNYAGGRQELNLGKRINPEDTNNISNGLQQQYLQQTIELKSKNIKYTSNEPAAFLSGFCLMMKREVYDKIGGIDELYSPGGFCDNDFLVRATEAGYGAIICSICFIYHYGSVTLNSQFPEMRGGVANWHKYVNKFKTNKDNKLLLIQRLKIDDEKNLEIYRKCSEQNNKFVDAVVILSDRSDNFTYEKAKAIWGDKLINFMINKKLDGLDEIRDRSALLDFAYKSKYDWCLVFDHDECFSEGTTKERLHTLMNPLNPKITSYEFYLKNYWKSNSLIRIDDNWGQTFLKRMWKNIYPPVLRSKFSKEDAGFHCGAIPVCVPLDAAMLCDITIDHFGYVDQEHIDKKIKFYEDNDHSPDLLKRMLVHDSGTYSHLKDGCNMQMTSPKPFDISINIMTKNEETDIGTAILNYFSIAKEFVIIDTGSTDHTVEWVESIGIKVHKMDLNDNFSAVRNKCIELSTGKYCVHLDPDEPPTAGYLQKIVTSLIKDPDIVIWHLKNVHKTGVFSVTKQPRIFRRCKEIYYNSRVHETLTESLEKIGKALRTEDPGLMSINTGFLTEDQDINQKLAFYGRLLEKEIEENPNNTKARFELALHYRNLDKLESAEEQLGACIEHEPSYLLPKRELALMRITEAYDIIKSCENFKAEPNLIESLKEIEAVLRPLAKAHVKVGQKDAIESVNMV